MYNVPHEKYLLVPAMPTPNGPLHLGHVSGPYLKMDIIARSLRRIGKTAALVSCSDVWEMHVLPRALECSMSPEDVCLACHEEILESFEKLNIQFDAFFNPLDQEYSAATHNVYRSLYDEVAQTDLVSVRSERIPFSTKYDQPVVGSHIGGECPGCGVPDLVGFYCEDCGLEASPEDLIGVWSELPADAFDWRDYSSAFINVPDPDALRKELEYRCADPKMIDLALHSLAFNNGRTRLTHPTPWGVSLNCDKLSSGSVFFSYPGMYALSVMCGEVAKPFLGVSKNPFSANVNDVHLVKSFGFDNTTPYLLAATALGLTSKSWRPFDRYLTNFFATLDGRKFSTSGRHAIWANAALDVFQTSADTLRAFMCLTSPQHEIKDFSQQAFNEFKAGWEGRIQAATEKTSRSQLSSEEIKIFKALYALQVESLDPDRCDVRKAFDTLEGWLDVAAQGTCGSEWAHAFALLAYPIVPELSAELLQRTTDTSRFILHFCDDIAWQDEIVRATHFVRSAKKTTANSLGQIA